jgi:hypothetical protein
LVVKDSFVVVFCRVGFAEVCTPLVSVRMRGATRAFQWPRDLVSVQLVFCIQLEKNELRRKAHRERVTMGNDNGNNTCLGYKIPSPTLTLRRGLGFGSGQWQALPSSAIRGF